jgi:hydrogenase maturation protein HypF
MVRKRILTQGVVQGVGFRPFVYRLAHALGLKGYVLNESGGVVIEVEGAARAVENFTARLRVEAPPLAQIQDLSCRDMQPLGERDFQIRHSDDNNQDKIGLVPPDVGVCEDCARDFTDPENRRYRYAFTNCTNCGPRYSIIQGVPYDRPKTTMSEFAMCDACLAEYEDPLNRRFHAQPNACPVCGPELELWSTPEGSIVKCANVIEEAHKVLRSGRVLAVKGLGGFHLACDAENDLAVRRLRERKRRSDKAFALMARDVDVVESFCLVSDADRAALESSRKPIVLLPRRPGATISPAVAPGNTSLGFMLPYTPLHRLLLDGFRALVMTSGNLSEEPIVSRNQDLWRLEGLADDFLVHNRRIQTRVDDSVVRTFEGRLLPVRRSRGFAPDPIDLGIPVSEILACGGELKNTFCLTKDHYAILSQHIGDLENLETLEFFRETLDHMKQFFRVDPRLVAHDLHPDYLSTKLALKLPGMKTIGVQHHHAHVASCMAENHLEGKVIGVAFDGTGFGTDGHIWGGEFLACDYAGFERCGHFRYIPLAGGDSAIRQPWRAAISYLRETFGSAAASLDLPVFAEVSPDGISVVARMLSQGVNTVRTSSCGRLFDAVASIIGLRQVTNYEGQAAIELEAAAVEGVDDQYRFEIEQGAPSTIDVRPAIESIVRDRIARTDTGVIAARFHNTVCDAVIEMCRRMRRVHNLKRVCLSGGTFQNMYLLKRTVTGLRRAGFDVFVHSQVPANDGGLALGQAAIANAISRAAG